MEWIMYIMENPVRVLGAAVALFFIGLLLKLGIHEPSTNPAQLLEGLFPDFISSVCEVFSPLLIKAGEILGLLGVGYLVLVAVM